MKYEDNKNRMKFIIVVRETGIILRSLKEMENEFNLDDAFPIMDYNGDIKIQCKKDGKMDIVELDLEKYQVLYQIIEEV